MQREEKGSCAQAAGIGCLVLVLAGAVGGYIAFRTAKDMGPGLIATGMETSAEQLLKGLKIPDSERAAVMAPIRAFTQDIRDGKVTLEQGVRVVSELADERLIAAIGSRGFEAAYVADSDLTADEKQAAHVTVTRFAHGVVESLIPDATVQKVLDSVSTTRTDAQGKVQRTFKDTLTRAELDDALASMAKAADAAEIAVREFEIDLGEIVKQAIARGRAKDSASDEAAPNNGQGDEDNEKDEEDAGE